MNRRTVHDSETAKLKRMLNIRELSSRIGLQPQTIRNKLQAGTFPIKTKKLGGKLLWDIKDIDRFLDGLRSVN